MVLNTEALSTLVGREQVGWEGGVLTNCESRAKCVHGLNIMNTAMLF